MSIVCMGLSFKTATVELRERVSLAPEDVGAALERLCGAEGVEGAVILSTCNRFEVFVDAKTDRQGMDALREFGHESGMSPDQLRDCVYFKREGSAFEHIVRVACSLESQVLGEAQILGQVKRAFELASGSGTCTEPLTNLFKQAIHAGKRVHEETDIGAESVSLSTTALKAAKTRLGTLAGKRVALVGAGEMARLAAVYLQEQGVGDLVVTSRTLANAQRIAQEFGGRAVPFDQRYQELAFCDAAFVALRGQDPAITADELAQARTAQARAAQAASPTASSTDTSLFIIDQGMPRNVEAACGSLPGVEVMDLDALNQEMEASRAARQRAAMNAERIAAQEAAEYAVWYQQRYVAPTIKDIYAKAEAVSAREVTRAKKSLAKEMGRPLSDQETQVLEMMADSVVKKILHGPTIRLRKEASQGDSSYYTAAARYLFGLDAYPVVNGAVTGCPHGYSNGCSVRCEAADHGCNLKGAHHV